MKTIYKSITLLAGISMASAETQLLAQDMNLARAHNKPTACCPDTTHTPKPTCKRNKITELPYTIKHPGVYTFCKDLVFRPTADAAHAITIKEGVHDVDIDFAGYSLRMHAKSTTADNHGIFINATCENIVIHGGTIQGFSASQIRGLDRLNTIEVSDMVLKGIGQDQGGQRMVNEAFTSGVNFGPTLEGVSFEPDPSVVSNNITLQNLTINNIYMANLEIADQAAWGVALFSCNNVHMDHVNVSGITNNGLVQKGNGLTYGFGLNLCTNCISQFCTGNDITSFSPNLNNGNVTGDAQAMVYLVCDRIENYDCSFSNCVGTRRGEGLVWIGSTNFIAERCVSDSNIAANPLAKGVQSTYGFEAIGDFGPFPPTQRGVLRNCEGINMPIAFVIDGCIDVIVEDCNAIAGNIPTAPSFIAGFYAGGSDGIAFKNCVATDFAFPDSDASGFMVEGSINVNILGCKSTKNFVGITVYPGSEDIIADANELAFNALFGLLDYTPVQTPNLYTRNVAFANATNYSVNTANPNFAVVQANQGAGFPLYTAANASPLSNFDLQP